MRLPGWSLVATSISLSLTLLVPGGIFPLPVAAQTAPASAPSPAASAVAAVPAAAGAAGPAIESILLQYQSSAESAARIAHRIDQAVGGFSSSSNPMVVIATPADVSALVALRVVLGQAGVIEQRVKYVTDNIGPASFPCKSPPSTQRKKPNTGAANRNPQLVSFGLTIASPADLQTLLQTIASLGAVNQTLSPAAGTLNDTSLINLVAGSLPASRVFIPSVYPPGLIATDFGQSLIGTEILKLESQRRDLYAAADRRLNDSVCQSDPSGLNKSTLAELSAEVISASGLVDSFETSLFSGQSASPAAAASAAPAPTTGTGTGASASATPPTLTAPTTVSVGNVGAPLVQLLNADYMLRRLTAAKPIPTYFFVTLHSLESGGNALTTSNLFSGSHVSFSGGAAATFAIYDDSGTFLCSGISYGYRGFIDAGDIGTPGLGNMPIPGQDPQQQFESQNPNKTGEFLPAISHYTSASAKCPAS